MSASTGRAGPSLTSAFGVGRRESHDASDFYARFAPPELTLDDTIAESPEISQEAACLLADALHLVLADLSPLPDNCAALVVTRCSGTCWPSAKRVLEPGGSRVNVANLGRRPYRSLSADVCILQDDLAVRRGPVIWRKGEAASGSRPCGWFPSAANPVLRDVTERVMVARKGRFDRARSRQQRRRLGLPHESEIAPDEFIEATLDVWSIAPESARRVKHPALFPVAPPQRLIGLYTFPGRPGARPVHGVRNHAAGGLARRPPPPGQRHGPVACGRQQRLKEELRGPCRPGRGERTARARLLDRAGAGGGRGPWRLAGRRP